jgi:hypothetical protein
VLFRSAYWTEVSRGQVVSACQPFNARGDIWNAPAEARLAAQPVKSEKEREQDEDRQRERERNARERR